MPDPDSNSPQNQLNPEIQATIRVGFEWDQLVRTPRSGWHHINEDPESVSNHVCRAAVLAYVLAQLEEHPNPEYVATLALFHDVHETRIGDLDMLQKAYISEVDKERAIRDMTEGLGPIGDAILEMWREVEEAKTPAGKIAKDADILEQALRARQLVVDGNAEAQAWIDYHAPRLSTDTGKKMIEQINTADPTEWWKRKFYGS